MNLQESWDEKQQLLMLPQTLEECFDSLKRDFVDYTVITNYDEKQVGGMLHMTVGMWIRNKYGLHLPDKTTLVKWFNKNDIHHPDDMSNIIITSFWRHLKGVDLKLEEQFNHYIEWWEKNGKT